MRLSRVFPGAPAELLRAASAFDDWQAFRDAVAARPADPASATLLAEADALAAALEARAETGRAPPRLGEGLGGPVFAGQQAYVDYRLGMVAKVDALEEASPPAFCALVEYDTFASDRELSRTDLPRVDARSPEPRLTLRFHPGRRARGRMDMRRVPAPDEAGLARILADLRGTITLAGRALGRGAFDAGAARRRLDAVWADYAFAAARARHAGDFNLLWTVRTLRRLGWRVPLVPLGELWDSEGMMALTAATLVPLIRDNECFVRAVDEAVALAAPHDPGTGRRGPGHVPLSLTDAATGIRAGLRVVRRGGDHVLEGCGGPPFSESVGGAGEDELLAFLQRHRGRVTPNVFAPVFLARAGVAGVLNGRGAIRYSLVVAHVLRRVFGIPHPPSFLCAGDARPADPFAAARAAAGASSDAAPEPTLLSRLLTASPHEIRDEVHGVWR